MGKSRRKPQAALGASGSTRRPIPMLTEPVCLGSKSNLQKQRERVRSVFGTFTAVDAGFFVAFNSSTKVLLLDNLGPLVLAQVFHSGFVQVGLVCLRR